MSDEPKRELLSPNAMPPLEASLAAPKERSLVADMAEAANLSTADYWTAVKTCAGCRGAENGHFMVLLLQAKKYDLDPLSSPPQLQLLDVGAGPQVYARVDAYKAFIQRAKDDGVVEWTKYEDKWIQDPAVPPDKPSLVRAGVYTGKFKREDEPVELAVLWREWNTGKGQWATKGSQMLRHRAAKEWAREYLGYYIADEDDAARIGDSIKTVEAEVRDAAPIAPAIPIRAIGAADPLPPPPMTIEVPQGKPLESAPGRSEGDVASQRHTEPASSVPDAGPDVSPAASDLPPPPDASGFPDPTSEEGQRLARELDEAAARDAGLFGQQRP